MDFKFLFKWLEDEADSGKKVRESNHQEMYKISMEKNNFYPLNFSTSINFHFILLDARLR